ncbi:cytochrome P450 [Streptomyces sp. NPDC000594]|uniref:cytochrome P450 n=1 Tax=Streptomyces sp. NPDC000594 TaxID=3154261 RepID=UPI003326A879
MRTGPGPDLRTGGGTGGCPAAALHGPGPAGDALPAHYARLRREHGPVVPVTVAPGVRAWLVIGHRELLRLTREEQDFSHDPRHWAQLREGRVPADSPILPIVGWRPSLLYADGQQHRRMRSAVSAALDGINGHELRRGVRAAAERLIASFAGRREADLVGHYARTLPTQVITALLGLDGITGGRLAHAIGGLAAADEESAQAGARVDGILRTLIAAKRERPGSDITSALLRHPAGLTDEEVLHNLVVIFVTGRQTAVHWISTTLWILLCDPAFRSSLTVGHLSVDDALDLVLWRHPPTQVFPARYATRAVELGGRHIAAGDMLLLGLAGANLDPAALPQDGGPVIGNRSHLAFGAGPHACPAQDQARLITRTAVETVRHRLPDLELAVPESALSWVSSPWATGLAALPVRFSEPQFSQDITAGG